jgi:hypothetical protein
MDKTGHGLEDICTDGLKPALASIQTACKYMGDVSRAKFYSDILPHLETVHVGARHLVVVASMDRLIAKLLSTDNTAANGLVSRRHAAPPISRVVDSPRHPRGPPRKLPLSPEATP